MGKDSTLIGASDVERLAAGEHDLTADASPVFYKIGGKYAAAPTPVADGDAVVFWLDPQGFIHPHLENISLHTFTTISANSTGTAVGGLGGLRDLDVQIRVTLATGTAPIADIRLDTQLDGTNWVNLYRANDFTGTTDVITRVIHLTRRNAGGEVPVSADAGTGTVRAIGWGDKLRARVLVGGTSPSFSGTIVICGIG